MVEYVLKNALRTQIIGALTFGAIGCVYGHLTPQAPKPESKSTDNATATAVAKVSLKVGAMVCKGITFPGWIFFTALDITGASGVIGNKASEYSKYYGLTDKVSEWLCHYGLMKNEVKPESEQSIWSSNAIIKAQAAAGLGVLAAVVFHTVEKLDMLTLGSSALGALYFLYSADSKGELGIKIEESEKVIWDAVFKEVGCGAFIGTAIYWGVTG